MASITSTGKAQLPFAIPADADLGQLMGWVADGKITLEQAQAASKQREERIRAEATKRGSGASISFKVSKVGAVSVYGLQRWPVTLYRGQWERLLAKRDELVKFIADNAGALSDK